MNTIKNDSKLLYFQARYQFEKAMDKFQDGTIKSEPQLVQTVFQSFQDFFTNMGKPHMVPRYAEENGPPWSEDYNNMMKEIKEDLETLFQEIEILGRSLYTDFNHNVMQIDIIESEYGKVYDKLKDLEMYAGYSEDGMIRFGRDDFLNGLKIDYDRISGTPLEITKTGVSLPLAEEATNVALNAKVTIVPGNQKHNDYILGADSNGFPGNNNEVTMISDDLLTGTSGYQHVGKDDNHGNYGTIIDGNPNTWFEYEMINLRDHEKRKITQQLGWDYIVNGNKTLRFAEDPEDGTLKLHLQIVLEEEEIINEINLGMYTPPNYGSQPAVVKNILVSSEFGAPASILSPNKRPTDYNFRFDPIKAKVISVILEQDKKYFTDIGHIFYEKKMNVKDKRNYAFETLQHKEKPEYAPRIDGPKINLESLGVKVDVHETNVEAYYPLLGPEDQGYSLDEITSDLFRQIDESTVESGIERFEGWRYCIGIRDIEILSAEYQDKGELVTKPYYFDKPVDRIAISASETIGDLLSQNTMLKYDWITYFVSIDDGKDWIPITPIEHEIREGDPPKLYTIQYVSSEEEIIEDRYGYLEAMKPVYALRLRVVIERPQDEAAQTFSLYRTMNTTDIPNRYTSSSLQGFQLQVETQQAEEDSEESIYTIDYKDSGYQPLPPTLPPDVIPDLPPVVEEGDDTGTPPGGGMDPEDEHENIMISLNTVPDMWCEGKILIVSGSVTSTVPIDKVELRINNTLINTSESFAFNSLDTIDQNVQSFCSAPTPESISRMQAMANTETQKTFYWTIPYSKAIELGLGVGDIATFEITAEDARSVDKEVFSVIIQECEELADCYQLESVIVHYYNESFNEIREIELAYEILPYEFDNGEGVMVTVGWDQSLKAPTIMVTDGYHEGQNAFIIHAVGIRYMNFEYENKVKWGVGVAQSSGGVLNSNLMLGDPNERTADWLEDIAAGDFEHTPSLNRINDWITISMDNDWVENHCPIEMEFNPEDNLKPDQPGESTGEDQYECIEMRKIFVQYYHTDSKSLKIKAVDLDDSYRAVYPITLDGRVVDVLVGWFEEYKGISISINSTNNQPLYVTAAGILIYDKKGVVRTEWTSTVIIERRTVKNSDQMIGEKKNAEELSWLDASGNPIVANAPSLREHQDAVVLGFSESLTSQLCLVDNIIDNRPDAPKFDRTPPEIIMDDIANPFYYQDLLNKSFPLQALIRDETDLKDWSIKSITGQWDKIFPDLTLTDNVDMLVPINVPDPIEYEESLSGVDIIFVIDTSGSMSNKINNVKENLSAFISYLTVEDLDVRLGYIGSKFGVGQQRSDMTPASEFNLDSVELNSGTWENLGWRQITDTTYGAASLYDQLRQDAVHHIILLTDTTVTLDLPQETVDELVRDNITVSVIGEINTVIEPDYDLLTEATGGLMLNVSNPNFHEEIKELSDGILGTISYIPDFSQVIVVEAEDEAGNTARKEITLNFTDRYRRDTEV